MGQFRTQEFSGKTRARSIKAMLLSTKVTGMRLGFCQPFQTFIFHPSLLLIWDSDVPDHSVAAHPLTSPSTREVGQLRERADGSRASSGARTARWLAQIWDLMAHQGDPIDLVGSRKPSVSGVARVSHEGPVRTGFGKSLQNLVSPKNPSGLGTEGLHRIQEG